MKNVRFLCLLAVIAASAPAQVLYVEEEAHSLEDVYFDVVGDGGDGGDEGDEGGGGS